MVQCFPVNPCPCANWFIGPGEQLPLVFDWSSYLQTVPGYALYSVSEATLTDLNAPPTQTPVPADPAKIDTEPALATPQPWDRENGPVRVIAGVATEAIIKTGGDTLGQVYRFDMAVTLKGCDGRVLVKRECAFIQVRPG